MNKYKNSKLRLTHKKIQNDIYVIQLLDILISIRVDPPQKERRCLPDNIKNRTKTVFLFIDVYTCKIFT